MFQYRNDGLPGSVHRPELLWAGADYEQCAYWKLRRNACRRGKQWCKSEGGDWKEPGRKIQPFPGGRFYAGLPGTAGRSGHRRRGYESVSYTGTNTGCDELHHFQTRILPQSLAATWEKLETAVRQLATHLQAESIAVERVEPEGLVEVVHRLTG